MLIPFSWAEVALAYQSMKKSEWVGRLSDDFRVKGGDRREKIMTRGVHRYQGERPWIESLPSMCWE